MKEWKDRQEWSGQLRKPALYDRISVIQNRRWYCLHWRHLFSHPSKFDKALENDPVIIRCKRIRGLMLAEAYGVDPAEVDRLLSEAV